MKIRIKDNALVFDFQCISIDKSNVKEIKKKLLKIYLSSNSNNIILNLQRVNFIDSSGLDVLLFAGNLAQQENGKISLFGLTPGVVKFLMQSRMYRFFDINKTEEESLEYIKDEEFESVYTYNILRTKLQMQFA